MYWLYCYLFLSVSLALLRILKLLTLKLRRSAFVLIE